MADVRVLVVDDQEPFRDAVAAVIGVTDGFVLIGSAVDGETSLVEVGRHRPDLVLMDVHLPGINGIEATRRIRAQAGAPAVVLVSTYELGDLGEDALRCGAEAYLAKADFGADRLREIWALAGR